MSTPRLTFLYPILFRSVRAPEAIPLRTPGRTSLPKVQRPGFHARTSLELEVRQQRYGIANEPPPHLSGAKPPFGSDSTASSSQTIPDAAEQKPDDQPSASQEQLKSPAAATGLETPSSPASASAPEAAPSESSQESSSPLETVLHMPSPADRVKKPLHLRAPPYIHHFDTYGLVKDLEKSGFSQEQAVTTMKAVRGLLTTNMELAREGLVSRSDVENESYLFRAACSELGTEIQNSRNAANEKMRTDRNQLQHEVDILSQRMSQEATALKDELKGMFDDRKMSIKLEQRNMESKIQDLNYKITVALSSDVRSEVEGLRWIITRRALGAIALLAISILATLRYSTYTAKTQQEARKQMADQNRKSLGGNKGGTDGSPVASQALLDDPADGLLVSETGDQGYVELG